MSTISTQLRSFKDPTKEQLTEIFFSIPPFNPAPGTTGNDAGRKGSDRGAQAGEELERMEINATLSLGPEAQEESYVSAV